jgi:hypothetical protein
VVGCGSDRGGLPGDVVAQVGSHSISKATLAHWTRVEGALARVGVPSEGHATWVMPEPPDYAACIARLEANASKATGRKSLTKTQFKSRCELDYHELQRKALSILIQTLWYEGMAAEEGTSLTTAELNQAYRQFIQREYSEHEGFSRYLAATGLNASDELLRVRKNLLETKLRQKLERELRAVRGRGTRERELQLKIEVGSTGKWLAKTNCRAGYVVLYCRQYRGPQRF